MWLGLSEEAWQMGSSFTPPSSQHSPVLSLLPLTKYWKAEVVALLRECPLGMYKALSSVCSTA